MSLDRKLRGQLCERSDSGAIVASCARRNTLGTSGIERRNWIGFSAGKQKAKQASSRRPFVRVESPPKVSRHMVSFDPGAGFEGFHHGNDESRSLSQLPGAGSARRSGSAVTRDRMGSQAPVQLGGALVWRRRESLLQ